MTILINMDLDFITLIQATFGLDVDESIYALMIVELAKNKTIVDNLKKTQSEEVLWKRLKNSNFSLKPSESSLFGFYMEGES